MREDFNPNDLLFGDGSQDEGEPMFPDEDYSAADGGYGMAIYSANGEQFNPAGIVPVNTGVRRANPALQGRPEKQRPSVPKQHLGKYLKVVVQNNGTTDGSFYLHTPTDTRGVIKPVGQPFASLEQIAASVADASGNLKVLSFDEDVDQFLQDYRGTRMAIVTFMRQACSDPSVSLSSYSTIIEKMEAGQNKYQQFTLIHGLGYSSERNQRHNELTYALEQKGQSFHIGGKHRQIFIAPAKSTIAIMILLGEVFDPVKAYGEGRV